MLYPMNYAQDSFGFSFSTVSLSVRFALSPKRPCMKFNPSAGKLGLSCLIPGWTSAKRIIIILLSGTFIYSPSSSWSSQSTAAIVNCQFIFRAAVNWGFPRWRASAARFGSTTRLMLEMRSPTNPLTKNSGTPVMTSTCLSIKWTSD